MQLYDDVFEEWSRRNSGRLMEIARHACTLARLHRGSPGSTSLDAFVDFRDRMRAAPEATAAQLAEATEDDVLRFLKEPNTRREVHPSEGRSWI